MDKIIDVEREAEKICLWGAARAGVIVVAPLVGTMALMANEVYMIMRLGELRGVKLEESAAALAKSEREGAWREMARQVAHEIKNPLTPMKLSIQYLQKAINKIPPM